VRGNEVANPDRPYLLSPPEDDRRIDRVLLMIDREYSSPVHLHVDGRLVTIRKPKNINSLVLPNKFSSIDPEGRFFSRVASDFHDREVLGVDPYFPFKQVLSLRFGMASKTKQ